LPLPASPKGEVYVINIQMYIDLKSPPLGGFRGHRKKRPSQKVRTASFLDALLRQPLYLFFT